MKEAAIELPNCCPAQIMLDSIVNFIICVKDR
jgi:hypothetical protein